MRCLQLCHREKADLQGQGFGNLNFEIRCPLAHWPIKLAVTRHVSGSPRTERQILKRIGVKVAELLTDRVKPTFHSTKSLPWLHVANLSDRVRVLGLGWRALFDGLSDRPLDDVGDRSGKFPRSARRLSPNG